MMHIVYEKFSFNDSEAENAKQIETDMPTHRCNLAIIRSPLSKCE